MKVEIQLKLQIIQDFLVLYQHLTNASNVVVQPKEEHSFLQSLLQDEQRASDTEGEQEPAVHVSVVRSPITIKRSMSDDEDATGLASGWRSLFPSSLAAGHINLSASMPSFSALEKHGLSEAVNAMSSTDSSDLLKVSQPRERRSSTTSAPISRRSSRSSFQLKRDSLNEEDKKRTLFFEGIVEIDGWQKFLLDILSQVRSQMYKTQS